MKYPFASKLLAEIGPAMGILVELEPEYQFAGELVFPNGRRHLFRNTNFNVNPAGSTEIAKDKGYTTFFLKKHGINAPKNQAFFSSKLNANLPVKKRKGIEEALLFANSLGYPVYIKPNNLSQGAFVTKAYMADDIKKTAEMIFTRTDVFLIEETCPGHDYRVVILGEKIISAYERVPLSLTGNGSSSIEELLKISQNNLENQGRPNSEINPLDSRIDIKLRELKLSRSTVLQINQHINLLDNANLSTGGTSVDVTMRIHPSFSKIAIKAAKILGLKLAGVDIICKDITESADSQKWNIIELNAAPGLDNYASLGIEQTDRVKNLYKEVLIYLSQM